MTALTVNAIGNDWGDSSGPYNEAKNPDGIGDSIIGEASFDPWVGKEETEI